MTDTVYVANAKFTPGPWRRSQGMETFGIVWGGRVAVADVASNSLPTEEQRANARLIAAAPELLAALQKCVSVFEQLADAGNYPLPLYNNGGWKFAADAIAKATRPLDR